MALEACLQVSTVATARVRLPFSYSSSSSSSSREKHSFPTCNGLKVASSSFSSLSSPFLDRRRHRKPHICCEARNTIDEVLVVTDSSWNNMVVGSEAPALVEFWAPWCGPCRMIAPVIDELAKEYAGKIVCYKVNTDECPDIATKYGIRSIPTVLFFKNGEKKESVIGAVPKSTLTTTIEKYLDR